MLTCRNRHREFPEHRSLTRAAQKAFPSRDRQGEDYANSRKLVLEADNTVEATKIPNSSHSRNRAGRVSDPPQKHANRL
jgi:hypothetical protein